MMNFTETNKPAKDVALHYAKKLNNSFVADVINSKKEITNKEDAIAFTNFFWKMTDESVDDYENNIEIAGVTDLEHWMEKLMNITIGYLTRCGFKEEWIEESNRINHG
jgi:hypothetical protein